MEWKYVKKLSCSVGDVLSSYQVKLPKDVVNMIEKNNGGRPKSPYFDTEKSKDHVFKSLLSYNKEDRETIYDYYSLVEFDEFNLYPIGMDSAGNFVCINLLNFNLVMLNHENNKIEKITKCDFMDTKFDA